MPEPEPVILHRCPGCDQVFDSPAICCIRQDGEGRHTESFPASATREAFVDPKAWPYDEGTDHAH